MTALAINRGTFFSIVRASLFGGSLTQAQVDGQNAVFDAFDKYGDGDIRKLSYVLATFYHETNKRMSPVIETWTPKDGDKMPSLDTAIARLENAWTKGRLSWVKTPYWRRDANGMSWLGRGGPQVTHKENYQKAEQLTGIPFTTDPDRMLEAGPAAEVAVRMMIRGDFRPGNTLGRYLNDDVTDYTGARNVINGDVKKYGVIIGGYAKKFYSGILTSMQPTVVHTVDAADPAAAPVAVTVAAVVPATPADVPPTPIGVVPPPPPPESGAKSGTAWIAAAGAGAPAVLSGLKGATDYVNSTSQQISDTAGQVTGTVTIVRDSLHTWSGLFGYFVSPPVIMALAAVGIGATGWVIYRHLRLRKEVASQ